MAEAFGVAVRFRVSSNMNVTPSSNSRWPTSSSSLSDWALLLIAVNDFGGLGAADVGLVQKSG